jgi:hypothetical protein
MAGSSPAMTISGYIEIRIRPGMSITKHAYYKHEQLLLGDRGHSIMNTRTSKIAIALSAALVATTAMAPLASAREWRGEAVHHDFRGGRGHGDIGAFIGLGVAALAGVAIAANVHPQPVYIQPAYAQPVYAQNGPNCTTINGYAACIGPDGNWQYVR